MVLAIGFLATACNTHDSVATSGTTTVPAQLRPTSTTSLAGDPSSARTTTTIAFDDEIEQVRGDLAKASGNLCAMVEATHKELNVTPQDTAEVREAIDLLVEMIHDMGTVSRASDAAIYDHTAEKLRAAAERADYSTTWIQSGKISTALDDPDFVAATSRLQQKYQETCTSSGNPPG
jgi:hypothetical protein